MFSSALTSTGAMRPGLLSGCYPERTDCEDGRIEKAVNALQGRLARLQIDRSHTLAKVCAAINRIGDEMSGLDLSQLDQLRFRLCLQLRSQGLGGEPAQRAFALIREVAARTLKVRHYDSQLMGGWAMLNGSLAEMETGEGKTLTATLTAATAALAGIPVHVITVNEYLVERDAKAMAPLYKALGLTVGYVTEKMAPEHRRAAYACDITYCTNKQVAFDYLRDRMQLGNQRSQLRLQLASAYAAQGRLGQCLLRGLCFAIIDEADSVLIDEARTPLILTRSIDSSAEHAAYRAAMQLARQLNPGEDYYLDHDRRQVRLSMAGQQRLSGCSLPAETLWQNARRREGLVEQALYALYLLQCDRDYLVDDGKVVIIDANTGRTMPDRSWERGLHQLVETKEGCPLTDAREQLGRLTYQRFFRRYLRLAGMTGTAREVSDELWSVYDLRIRKIPLHRPSRRQELPPRVYARAEQKWAAVVDAVRDVRGQGRPVLIGTASVADSELLSARLTAADIPHHVLNARQNQQEAEIVANAGRRARVTVATNMAGRGTDIPLGKGVAELGGLHVIATCRNEARRIDRQLYGRCARQGDPGSHQSFLSLEDEHLRQQLSPAVLKRLQRRTEGNRPLQQKLNLLSLRGAQKKIENRHRNARKALLQQERQTGRLLAFSGHLE
ncbi:MAG: prepilin peptidase [Desulfuromonadales bacterium]|nr:prepilin peptidase [Desulfuromonadales bacterium]